MLERITSFFLELSGHFFPSEEQPVPYRTKDYFTLVEQARQDWRSARERFDQISDPDLIDHAIFDLEAAERRYVYLLKKAREEGATIYTTGEGG